MGDSNTESEEAPRPWWTLPIALAACVLSAGLAVLVISLLDLSAMDGVFRRAAWWLTPWRAFPSIIDDWAAPASLSPAWSGAGDCARVILGQGMVLLLLHSLVFLTMVFMYAKYGWPPYWPDVRGRLSIGQLWARSAVLACWVFPLSQAFWSTWMKISDLQGSAGYRLVSPGFRQLIANQTAVLFGHAVVIAAVLRHSVVRSVGRDDLRCGGCGYMLRGLPEPRCPECGRAMASAEKASFGLRWLRSAFWRPVRWAALPVILLGLLLAPVWVGAVLAAVPTAIQRALPRSLQATCRRLSANPNAFPVRWNALLLVRRDGALGAVRFSVDAQRRWQYESAYWPSEAGAGRSLPEATAEGNLAGPAIGAISIGPWTFGYSEASRTVGWVYRPNPSYDVEIVDADECPVKLAWPDNHGQVEPLP